MRRIILALAAAVAMALMMVSAGPAVAQEGNPFTFNPGAFTVRTGEPALCRPSFASDLLDVSGGNSGNALDVTSPPRPTESGPATNAC